VLHIDVAEEAPCERVAGGFGFVEGPVWDVRDAVLLFSDIANDRILRLGADDAVDVFREPSGRSNGLEIDDDGAVVACLGGRREIVRIARDGTTTVLASSFDGKRLNSPNDLVLDRQGGVWFTDPRYGDASDVEQDVMGVYHVAKDGVITRVIADLERPNGIAISADESTLFVAEPNRREVYAYPIESPGVLGPGRVHFRSIEKLDGAGPDGMSIDASGQLWATYDNVLVLDATGRVVRRIPVPEKPTNLAFGGVNGATLFVTARTGLYRKVLKDR
jgi:gluconolactonase